MKELKKRFYTSVDMKSHGLENQLEEWQFYYNWHRAHGSLNGKSPIDRVCELKDKIPYGEKVDAMYEPSKERIQESNYRLDLELRKLK